MEWRETLRPEGMALNKDLEDTAEHEEKMQTYCNFVMNSGRGLSR